MQYFLTNDSERASSKGKGPAGPTLLGDETVYLEDIDPSIPKTPAKISQKQQEASSSSKRNRFYDHDPYRLPELDYEQVIATATRSSLPDPRLATEEELRAYIEELCPEDFDVTSPEFRELPTEIQYEIVGDLRLKSRQTSFKRLQNMLKNASTAMDFSRQQIVNLKKRNALTQQLLTTTDSIGNANISIPVRIASERNKEYVLIKNEGQEGGWTLGIGDGVSQGNAIDISADDTEDDSDMEMEEVAMYVLCTYIHYPDIPDPNEDLHNPCRIPTFVNIRETLY
jgi:DNA excision repair protein ERCC-5